MFRRREQQQASPSCAPGAGPGGQYRRWQPGRRGRSHPDPGPAVGSALKQLGQQTSLQLFFSPELVAGKQAPAVSGNLAPEQALQQLLQGSGLTFEMSGDTVVVKPLPTTLDLGSGSLELAPTDIKVVGDWLGDAQQSVVQNHPGARTVVRREAMVEKGAMNVRDVLRGIPGVQVQDSNGTGGSDLSLNVACAATSRLSPRSTVLIDGIPAAFAPYGQPQLSMAPISSGNLDSIDVVRGAGSVRYGPQNVGGVINFVTRAIPEKPRRAVHHPGNLPARRLEAHRVGLRRRHRRQRHGRGAAVHRGERQRLP
jgi:Fe(3+) dicitrate transport protein